MICWIHSWMPGCCFLKEELLKSPFPSRVHHRWRDPQMARHPPESRDSLHTVVSKHVNWRMSLYYPNIKRNALLLSCGRCKCADVLAVIIEQRGFYCPRAQRGQHVSHDRFLRDDNQDSSSFSGHKSSGSKINKYRLKTSNPKGLVREDQREALIGCQLRWTVSRWVKELWRLWEADVLRKVQLIEHYIKQPSE